MNVSELEEVATEMEDDAFEILRDYRAAGRPKTTGAFRRLAQADLLFRNASALRQIAEMER